MDETIAWLLEGPAWIEHRARIDLLGQAESDPQVVAARRAMLADPQIQALIAILRDWPVRPINSHKSAGHPLHQLTFLADIGLRAEDPGMDEIVTRVLDHASPQGPFGVVGNVPKAFGGTGEDQWGWVLCDTPLLLHNLLSFGLAGHPSVIAAGEHLIGMVRENGWPCAGSPELGRWRGPGRKEDPCPYANLIMLRALALHPDWRDSDAARAGAETQLALWTESRDRHPYMFFMGTDFRKLKAPLVWYDLLHVLDVLVRFPWLRGDPRLAEMRTLLASKADAAGRFTPESIWQAWRDWEFGQKKAPSRWLTLLALRIQRLAETEQRD